MRVVVFKIGGSVLDLPRLSERLGGLFEQRPRAVPLVVSGGGAAADLVRAWDRTHQLSAEASHWLAVRSMLLGTALLERLLPGARVVKTPDDVPGLGASPGVLLLDPLAFLTAQEHQGDPLPASWDVTSDSIAAAAAIAWKAAELVLVKSTGAPAARSIDEAQAAGLIDAYFHHLSGRLPTVSWVNLRHEPCRIVPWLANTE